MNVLATLRMALRSLWRNRMRSFLTALGVIIGVAAVIATVAIGEGAKAEVDKAFASIGSNMLIVLPGSSALGGARGGFGSMPTLTWNDFEAIRSEVPTVRTAAVAMRSSAAVLSEEQNWTTSVTGTSPEYFDIRNWPVALGAAFTSSDLESGNKVVVLGQTVVEKLYGPGADPVGQSVKVNNIPFQVVGVLAKKGQSPSGQDFDDALFMPHSTYRSKIEGGLQGYIAGVILVAATSGEATTRAEQQIAALLRDRHRLEATAEDDFSIRNLAEMASAQQKGASTLTMLLASVAAVSLLVGGIGIMNIMLVSVTERTREIGLRMAIGAAPHHILTQFLIEALALSMAGGALGVGLGIWTAQRIGSGLGWPVVIRPEVVAIASAFSALVGVVFGLYPARKAAQLDPIDALRFE